MGYLCHLNRELIMENDELNAWRLCSSRPYIDAPGPVPESVLGLRSWRYVLEVSSMCNLKCALCHAGNREGYEYKAGIMDMGLMERILDKIKSENANAVVCAYVNSEPFLHPRLPEVIASIKRRGLRCEIATNLNYMQNLDAVLAAKPDILTVSVSGFSQEVYERAHRGGHIEQVKKNIVELVEANRRGGHGIFLGVSYHMYNDNLGEELNQMRAFTEGLGILFMLSWGRVISIENTVQALRYLEYVKTGVLRPYEIGEDGQDLNKMFPEAKAEFIKSMERLRFHPAKAMEFYSRWAVSKICLIADVFTEIRWDGRVQLCAWTDDMRLTLGNYLEMSQDQISAARRGHPLCQECLHYRLNYYFHITDCTKWDAMDQAPNPFASKPNDPPPS